jgi:hypothetical protein
LDGACEWRGVRFKVRRSGGTSSDINGGWVAIAKQVGPFCSALVRVLGLCSG